MVKAGLGGQDLTWRQLFLTASLKELSRYRPYLLFWFAVVILAFSFVDRWYFGLEWFEWVPWMGSKSALVILFGVVIYVLWLRSEYKQWSKTS